MRAKLVLAAFMATATLATGLFIHVRLSQKPDEALAMGAVQQAAAEPAAEPAAKAEEATLQVPVKPTRVRTVSIPTGANGEAVDPDALGHDNPRWARARMEAEAAKAKAAKALRDAKAAGEPELAYAAPDNADAGQADDGDLTAAIPPTAIIPPARDAAKADSAPDTANDSGSSATRSVRIAKAVNLRASPRSGSRVIRVLPAGITVGLVSCKGWCEVSYQGSRGFIYKSFVQGGGGAPAKARAAQPKAAAAAEPKPSTNVLRIQSQR